MLGSLVAVTKGFLAVEAGVCVGDFFLTPEPSRTDRINAIVHFLFLAYQLKDFTYQKDPLVKVCLTKIVGVLDVTRKIINLIALHKKRKPWAVGEMRYELLNTAIIMAFRIGVVAKIYLDEPEHRED
jgi:hypothetical protein